MYKATAPSRSKLGSLIVGNNNDHFINNLLIIMILKNHIKNLLINGYSLSSLKIPVGFRER